MDKKIQDVVDVLKEYNQEHIINLWNKLEEPKKQELLEQINKIDFHQIMELYDNTKKEIEILWTLATKKDRVFSRDMLLNKLWGYDYIGDSRTVDSHIKRLRAKLEKYPHGKWEIKTIWGVGYKFEVSDDVKQ